MDFTALHRALGRQRGPLTDELLTAAVAAGVAESDDLDWKGPLPEQSVLARSDTVKDIAAMANSGGGLIVFGVKDVEKRATERCDVGEISENYERTLRQVAVHGIHPPVFNLDLRSLGEDGQRALAVIVPASTEVPHLIYRGEYFGAPMRNNADTEWMRERQLETMYRARLEERRNSTDALDRLYREIADGQPRPGPACFIAAARPRIPRSGQRIGRDHARFILYEAISVALSFAGKDPYGAHPLDFVAWDNPRIGFRRWTAPNIATSEPVRCFASRIDVHDDGSVTVAATVGGQSLTRSGKFESYEINANSVECCIADLMALIRVTGSELGTGDYELQLGFQWPGKPATDLVMLSPVLASGPDRDGVANLSTTAPMITTIRVDLDDATYGNQVADLATDVLNTGGILGPKLMTRRRTT
jgi:hypothetical protein